MRILSAPLFSAAAKPTFISKTLEGKTVERPIIENEHAAVLMNIDACRPGHALVVTKTPHEHLKELSPKEHQSVMTLVTQYQALWEKLPENSGKNYHYSIFINDGKSAGQSVPHFHVQIVPIETDNPVPAGALRHAINPNPSGVPKDKDQFMALIRDVYRPFNNNIDAIQDFSAENGIQSSFSVVG